MLTINKDAPGVKARQRYLGQQGLRLDIHVGVNGNTLYGRFASSLVAEMHAHAP